MPDGTVVLDEKGRLLADLVGAGTRFEAAAGGRGGLGNAALASRARKAPGSRCSARRARPATSRWNSRRSPTSASSASRRPASRRWCRLISAAKPKIADYPFTTLAPNLGVVSAGDHTFTVADVPGLIPGASEGRGLGLDFLRHIERCAVLVHVVDCATLEPGRDPISDIDALEAELAAYTPTLQGDSTLGDLAERPRAVVLNKIDVPEARELADFVRDEVDRAFGWPVFEVSAVAREGLRPLTFALWDMVAAYRAAQPEVVPRRPVIRPVPVDESGFTVESDGDGRLRRARHPARSGGSPRPISTTTRPSAISATGWPASASRTSCCSWAPEPGCAVTIGDMTFDWEPQTPAGVDVPMSGRGTDTRLERNRPGGRRRTQGGPTRHAESSETSEHPPGCRPVRAQRRRQDRHHRADHADRDVRRGQAGDLADAIEARMKAGSDVVIVSSGAIAAGIEPLRLTKRPADLATKQAAASVGQVALINSWSTAFARYDRTVGQVLLTAHDISMRVQHTNAQRTLDRLLTAAELEARVYAAFGCPRDDHLAISHEVA